MISFRGVLDFDGTTYLLIRSDAHPLTIESQVDITFSYLVSQTAEKICPLSTAESLLALEQGPGIG